MIFIQLFLLTLFVSLFKFLLANDNIEQIGPNGNNPSNEVSIPRRPRLAINRSPSTTIRHRGNRFMTVGQSSGVSKKHITSHVLSRKAIKKAHKNVQNRALQRKSSANRGLGKVAPEA